MSNKDKEGLRRIVHRCSSKMIPNVLTFRQKTKDIQLTVKGQGVLLFEHTDPYPCTFQICDKTGANGIIVMMTSYSVNVSRQSDGTQFVDPKNTKGLITTPGASYWLSLDAQNHQIYVGIGEARMETVIYTYTFPAADKEWLESLIAIQITDDTTVPLRLLRDPITRSVPLKVHDTQHLTMHHIASNEVLPSANLSLTAQKLYNCISGKHFQLNAKDFPDFAKAIEYNIATPGCWCHETLKAKSQEFGPQPNLNETYLRITLNENNGESPGIPYVMEIWPSGHYSPIHNHGGASAVIRVLHGAIHVKLFPFLGTEDPFGSADFQKGDVTWISPSLNQVHQLENQDSKTCITIQCYMYETDDNRHYDYFDYLDQDQKVQQFEPNSDMEFLTFKDTIRTEWAKRPSFLQRIKRWFKKN